MGQSASDSESLDSTLGLSVGYAYLPVQQLGLVGSVALLDISNKDEDGKTYTQTMYRVDGNAAYSFNQNLYLKGGANISGFTRGDIAKKMDPAIGLQAGLGFQINKNFGIDAGLVMMRQTATMLGVDVELQESGLELGLHGTF